jgi:prepilin-type N-terminal cleavage/methylation domain-containing protein
MLPNIFIQKRPVQIKKGFSLLEVVIVFALVSILSSIVYTSFMSLHNRQILDKEVAQVKSYIQKARMNSLNSKKGDTHGVVFSTSTVQVIEVVASSTIYTFTLNNRVALASSTLGTPTLTFARISGLPSATGTLTYTYSVGSRVIGTSTIVINGLGVVQ